MLEGRSLTLEGAVLSAGDLQVVREVQEGLAVTATPDVTVALDTTVDEPLKLEMLARETVSLIQNLRKEAGLAVTDRIVVGFRGVTPLLRQAVEIHLSYISSEVLAVSLFFDETETESKCDRNLDVEGEQALIFVAISSGKDPA